MAFGVDASGRHACEVDCNDFISSCGSLREYSFADTDKFLLFLLDHNFVIAHCAHCDCSSDFTSSCGSLREYCFGGTEKRYNEKPSSLTYACVYVSTCIPVQFALHPTDHF